MSAHQWRISGTFLIGATMLLLGTLSTSSAVARNGPDDEELPSPLGPVDRPPSPGRPVPEGPEGVPEEPGDTPEEGEGACCCHLITGWGAGGAIQVGLAAPAGGGPVNVPVGQRVPLVADAFDDDALTVQCQLEGCGPRPAQACQSQQVLPVPGRVTYRWELLSGAGGLVSGSRADATPGDVALGPAAMYQAPEELPANASVEIRLTVDDSPEYLGDIDDPPVSRVTTFTLVDADQVLAVPTGASGVAQGGAGSGPTGDCPCQPEVAYGAESAITPNADSTAQPRTLTVCAGGYALLGTGADDLDRLTLRCAGPRCSSPLIERRLNDALRYRWVASDGAIIGTSRKVAFQAPAATGQVTVNRFIDDSGLHPAPANEGEIADGTITVDVFTVELLLVGDYLVPRSTDNLVRYRLDPSPVDAVRLEVRDKDGKLVRTVTGLPTANDAATGWVNHKWDGLDDRQQPLTQNASPYRVRVAATKLGTDCDGRGRTEVKQWQFSFTLKDTEPVAGTGVSGIDQKTVNPMLVQATVKHGTGDERRVPVFALTPNASGAELKVLFERSFEADDHLVVYTSPTNTDPIDTVITVLSQEGGGLDIAGNEWDMDPSTPGVERKTEWTVRVAADGSVNLQNERISVPP